MWKREIEVYQQLASLKEKVIHSHSTQYSKHVEAFKTEIKFNVFSFHFANIILFVVALYTFLICGYFS